MSKVALKVEKTAPARARRYGKKREAVQDDAPVLKSLRGILKSANVQAYREHIAAQYR